MDFASIVIVQETEINKRISPFYSGQVFLKTPEKATVKYLLTGIDDGDEYQVEIEKNKLASVPKVELIDEWMIGLNPERSEEHTSELQSRGHLVCRLLLDKKR